jgi:hypothetical protein
VLKHIGSVAMRHKGYERGTNREEEKKIRGRDTKREEEIGR